jgi:hypothetical protein
MNSKFTEMIDKRQAANRDILTHLSTLVELYPDLRFGQILAISNAIQYEHCAKQNLVNRNPDPYIEVVKDPFGEESAVTLQRVANKIKQYKDEGII